MKVSTYIILVNSVLVLALGIRQFPNDNKKFNLLSQYDSGDKDSKLPVDGQVVKVHYTGTLKSGKKFDSSYDRGTPFTFEVGRGKVIPCWDDAVSRMRVGESTQILCEPENAYGARGVDGVIPPYSQLIFDIKRLE